MTYDELISNNNIDISQNEKDFQNAWEEWDNNNSKAAWDRMWFCVFYTCMNIAKNIYTKRCVIVDNEVLLDRVTDGTTYVMKFIKRGVRPAKLSSYCFLRVRRFIDDPKQVWYDTNITQFPENKKEY